MTEQRCVRTYDEKDFSNNRTRVCCEELNPYLEKGWYVVFVTAKADYIEYIIEREIDNSGMEIEK